ncbi:hypothetical protein PIROE2DRAFT_17326 [Piromyces sp. E2]|nr:hypothetical protein PIROE2DRAFT_17326 [Piromyces sp. E2]|eukprot:OUM57631.1 hypothetical protein PIROE2DRAFT_17326 [Piromyces sp. E2]
MEFIEGDVEFTFIGITNFTTSSTNNLLQFFGFWKLSSSKTNLVKLPYLDLMN